MVRQHGEVGRHARLAELLLKPGKLLGLLLRLQRKVMPMLPVAVRPGHVAVEHDAVDQRVVGREVKGVPPGRQRPTGRLAVKPAAGACVGQLGFYLIHGCGQQLVVVVAQHGVGQPRKDLGRVHLLKRFDPARRAYTALQVAIPAVTQHEQGLGVNAAGLHVASHAVRHLRLCHVGKAGGGFCGHVGLRKLVLVAPVADHDGVGGMGGSAG